MSSNQDRKIERDFSYNAAEAAAPDQTPVESKELERRETLDAAQAEILARLCRLEARLSQFNPPAESAATLAATARPEVRRRIRALMISVMPRPILQLLKFMLRRGTRSEVLQLTTNMSAPHHATKIKDFDAEFYLRTYPDISRARLDPYYHFVNFGMSEGRLPHPPRLNLIEGTIQSDPARDFVLVVSHEASRTGAPIVALNLARSLGEKYNVVTLCLGGGPLIDAFRGMGAVIVAPSSIRNDPTAAEILGDQLVNYARFRFAIVNSIESRSMLAALARHYVPTISLIHEFAEYTRPSDAFRHAVFWAGEMVFSTLMTRDSAIAAVPELSVRPASIVPQGRCTVPTHILDASGLATERDEVRRAMRPVDMPDQTVVIMGAGAVQIRKGVDIFLECAARVVKSEGGRHCRFVWIGKGYDPVQDLGYSVYLADQVRKAGLADHVSFLDETSIIEAAYEAADVFILTSRFDPLPNVAIDAMTLGLPVVCFEGTTGIADLLTEQNLAEPCVAPYLDSVQMAEKVLALVKSEPLRARVGSELRRIADEQFDMARYCTRIEAIATEIGEKAAQERDDAKEIEAASSLRLDFFLPDHDRDRPHKEAVRAYVRGWASGMGRRKPFPGFHPGIFAEKGECPAGVDPLAAFIRAGQPDGPWRHEVIGSGDPGQRFPGGTRVALHCHVFYADLLPELMSRLYRNRIRPDLFLSVPNERVRAEVRNTLRGYSGKVVDVRIVPNRGRDIGPFLTAFGPNFLADYDIVGHLHTKKTADLKDESVGRIWYHFLLENLLGGRARMADIILSRMASDESIGMVFPDDPNVIGWGKNKLIAQELGQRLGLSELPESSVFPVGTMFWARPRAIEPLIGLNLQWDDYPAEPLPYDGTILHALERLFPLTATIGGSRIVLTNVKGVTR